MLTEQEAMRQAARRHAQQSWEVLKVQLMGLSSAICSVEVRKNFVAFTKQ